MKIYGILESSGSMVRPKIKTTGNKNKVWLVNISEFVDDKWEDARRPAYFYWKDEHFLFNNNHRAVDFIRENAQKHKEEHGLREVWNDVSWTEEDEEYCSYLAYDDKYGNEFRVYFSLKEVN